jgi:glycosyltransferase involved in cell wall biosynthesis
MFDADKNGELQKKITMLVDSAEVRQRVGQRARRDIEQKWNWDRNAQKMIRIFEDVLQRRRN